MVVFQTFGAFGGETGSGNMISLGYGISGRPGIPGKVAAVCEAAEVPIAIEKEEQLD